MFINPSRENANRAVPARLVRSLALVGVLVAGMLTVITPASAGASAPVASTPVAAAPVAAAPVSAKAATVLAAAVSPGISPAANNVRYVSNPAATSCGYGVFCAFVLDPTVKTANKWKVFDLYYCKRYYLSYWQGNGSYNNQQYGGVWVTFYSQSGKVLKSFNDKGPGTYNWDPVWSIRNC
ncbi:hypothetical protein K7640_20990 [Micromonospora sp. PLK6-60]|uniref:hypothetical protein n=1 Tax=Micromonospora sp. PLK6-60 TaxID=2873383 RepID=UPI001CA6A612|nr:hypothetical protein [Micromonospora sp. PLK6-60]MBY8874311.1 hypothetical protein [Micromonospora sp. PLK6-60]